MNLAILFPLLLFVFSCPLLSFCKHACITSPRDIACRNVLINSKDVGLRAAVSDFGLSLELTDGKTVGRSPKKAEFIPLNISAPEALAHGLYSEKTDVYMFGMLCYELFARKNPYEGTAIVDECFKTKKWAPFKRKVQFVHFYLLFFFHLYMYVFIGSSGRNTLI